MNRRERPRASKVHRVHRMSKPSLLLALLLGSAAWATGERIVVAPADNPLRPTLCISMSCVSGGAREAVVTTRPKGRGLELTVTHASGAVRLTYVVPLMANGRVSSTELIHAATLAITAIEGRVTRPVATASSAVATRTGSAKAAGGLKRHSNALPGALVARR